MEASPSGSIAGHAHGRHRQIRDVIAFRRPRPPPIRSPTRRRKCRRNSCARLTSACANRRQREMKTAAVLVHGLWLNGADSRCCAATRARTRHRGASLQYPTVRGSMEQTLETLERFVARIAADRVHFIGHSLGGVVLCRYFQTRLARGRGGWSCSFTTQRQPLRAHRREDLGAAQMIGPLGPRWSMTRCARLGLPERTRHHCRHHPHGARPHVREL